MLVYKAIYLLYLPLVYKDELLSVGDEVFPKRGVPHGVAVLELKLDTSLYSLGRIRHGVHHLSIKFVYKILTSKYIIIFACFC